MGSIKNLSNQKFGKLTAIRPTNKRINRCVVWECQCDCGNICEIKSNNLLTGHTQSCGCLNRESCSIVGKTTNKIIDETNKRYGKLTVIKLQEVKNACAYWICKCDCGNEILVAGNHLRAGHTKSCGCLKSSGELKINEILIYNNIHFMSQYTVSINNSYYRFDYALLDDDNNIIKLIEYDGEQHFIDKISNNGWNTIDTYLLTKQRDEIKNNYCRKHNIKLNRIPYWAKDQLTLDDIVGNKYEYHYSDIKDRTDYNNGTENNNL